MPNDINIKIPNDMNIIKAAVKYSSKRRRFTESTATPTYLPEWFLVELFCRVPVKIIFKFKCVSKQWLSILSDPSFPSYYISRALPRSVPPRYPWSYICEDMHVEDSKVTYPPECKIFTGNYLQEDSMMISSDFYHVIPLPTSQEAKRDENYFIKAIDNENGFLLYCLRDYRFKSCIRGYYICNPITKQWIALPPPAPEYLYREINVGFVTQVESGHLTSYKVILVNCPRQRRKFIEFLIFSSETGEWEESTANCELHIQLCRYRRSVVLNRTLHWIDFEHGIVAYDPYNSTTSSPDYKLRVIPFPPGYSKQASRAIKSACDVHQGRLKYFEVVKGSSITIWELKEYYSSGDPGWYMQHTVRTEDVIVAADSLFITAGISFIELVGFHPYDQDVICLEKGCRNLVSYNIKTRRVEAIVSKGELPEKDGKSTLNGYFRRCFIFVHPLWPISILPSLLEVELQDDDDDPFWGKFGAV